ncbi:phosducin [Gregarina niphandrodes]|uniref:Phosducin n=1 Tax=Gregarina niphandrodes TaxID=110365 RepID=A0A023BC19_GRENI|nr:phosducin [Gregarina niphandrodes]EZG81692.1 phosducin [Gregarina niphandrodes]|eukprot:XP_011134198.1 phosducin [Gregarina niphandrodes]
MSTTNPVNRTTEWDDLQIKYGNYAPLEREVKAEEISLKAQEAIANVDPLAGKNLDQLDELEDDIDEDVLETYRRRRLEELKAAKAKEKFGDVYNVSMDNYVDEVTLASKQATVILHLYDDSLEECVLMNRALEQLSKTHRDVKFCRGLASRIIKNYHQKPGSLPTLLIYKDSKCVNQVMGISMFCDKVVDLQPQLVEFVLGRQLKLFHTETEDPRNAKATRLRKYLTKDSDESDQEVGADALHTGAYDKTYADLDLDRIMNVVRK